MTVALRKNLKLSPKCYGPFEIIEKIGQVAYKLRLPKKVGVDVKIQESLPIISAGEDSMTVVPQAALDRRMRRNKEEILVHWQGLSPAEATWEDYQAMKTRFPEASLEDKGAV
ncbi:uncharacterized protein LOC119370193 [Jatropha curcas]|uniref:uncharacterized protein LOC119370193 n=1 Tax=Jatropha curcas TaxID=180498 RepID=UPI0018963908|nr:uncharacterized protein LOC119370193 [Jatropha curcas]